MDGSRGKLGVRWKKGILTALRRTQRISARQLGGCPSNHFSRQSLPKQKGRGG